MNERHLEPAVPCMSYSTIMVTIVFIIITSTNTANATITTAICTTIIITTIPKENLTNKTCRLE